MAIVFNGVEYLVGKSEVVPSNPKGWTHIGHTSEAIPRKVMRHDGNGGLCLEWVPAFSEWARHAPLKTRAELLEYWS